MVCKKEKERKAVECVNTVGVRKSGVSVGTTIHENIETLVSTRR
jgi:hypothetical protein